MNTRYRRILGLCIVVIGLLTVSALPVFAGSDSVSGTMTPGGPTMPVIFITTPNCTGQGATPVMYQAYPVIVDTAGVYSFDLNDPSGAFSMYLHSAGFVPANGFPTCLAADNAGVISFTYALAANTIYFAVVIDDTFAQAGGSYSLTVSGPGTVCINGCTGPGTIEDGRINNADLGAPFAVYCTSNGVEVWSIGSGGHGALAFTASETQVGSADSSAGNAVVAEGSGIRLYKLASGELQVVGAPDSEGKVYNVLFNAFPCSLVSTRLDE